MSSMIQAVLFDYGGVLAEEGFREGLKVIGKINGLDPDVFFGIAETLIHETGYLVGAADEAAYWNAVRNRTGIQGNDAELREEILKRFVLRPDMVAVVDALRSHGITVAMLSDQTNWLEEIDQQAGLLKHFDRVFNSFRTHKSKRDATVFKDVCEALGTLPPRTLFIDDNISHIRRAKAEGLQTILFASAADFKQQMRKYVRVR